MIDQQPTVLIVDDDPEIVKLVRRTLQAGGYQLLSTTSPAEAVQILLSRPIDILLSDIDMPGMTGHELTALAREVRPQAVRILVTGGNSLDAAVRAINEGEVHRFVKKPFGVEELRAVVSQAAARRRELELASEAGRRAALRGRMNAQLEAEHPGITRIDRGADGVYEIDADRARDTAAAIGLRSGDALRT